MRPVALTALVAQVFVCIALSGCSSASNNAGKIEGTKWNALRSKEAGGNLLEGITLEFTKEGTFSLKMGPVATTGKYTLGGGDQVTLHHDKEVEGLPSEDAYTIKISGDEMEMIGSKGPPTRYKRKPPVKESER